MKVQYQFQIVFIRLSLKKPLKREATFQLSLLDNLNPLTQSQGEVSFQELKIKRIQKIVDLQKLSSFKFRKDGDPNPTQNFAIELRFEGIEEETSTLQINTLEIITQFQQTKKSIFEQKHEWSMGQLEFKVYVSAKEVESLTLNVHEPPLEKAPSIKSNNISRTRRPPELNISRKGALATSQARSINTQPPQQQPLKPKVQQLFKGIEKESPPKQNPVIPKKPSPQYLELESPMSSFPESFSALALFKRKQKAEPENAHVKELIESHHPHDETAGHTTQLSLKLKAVIVLIVIGLLFLIVDTLADRRLKKLLKGNTQNTKKPHSPTTQSSKKEGKGKGKNSKKTHKKAEKH